MRNQIEHSALKGLIDGMWCAGAGVMSYYYYLRGDTFGFVAFLIVAVIVFLFSLTIYRYPELSVKRKITNFTWIVLWLTTVAFFSVFKEGNAVAILGWGLITLSYSIDIFLIRWDSGKNDISD
jgi:hypothetical protein